MYAACSYGDFGESQHKVAQPDVDLLEAVLEIQLVGVRVWAY